MKNRKIVVWLRRRFKTVWSYAGNRRLKAVRARLKTPAGAVVGIAAGLLLGMGIGLVLPHSGHRSQPEARRHAGMSVAITRPAATASTPAKAVAKALAVVPPPAQATAAPAPISGPAGSSSQTAAPPGPAAATPPSEPAHAAAGRPAPGAPPWRRYATAVPPTHGRPMIAIDIDDMGVDVGDTAIAMKILPPAVTFAFLPYGPHIRAQVDEARRLGHEILVHVPMQPDNSRLDPGPMVLKVDQTAAEILRRLDWDLGRFSGYVGINNHMGSRFTSNAADMRVVMQALKARRLMYMDSETIASSVGYRVARAYGVPAVRRDIFLDDVPTKEKVLAQLAMTVAYAKRYGRVIAIGHPRPGTLAAFKAWLPTVEKDGVVLVPLTALLPQPARATAQDKAKLGAE